MNPMIRVCFRFSGFLADSIRPRGVAMQKEISRRILWAYLNGSSRAVAGLARDRGIRHGSEYVVREHLVRRVLRESSDDFITPPTLLIHDRALNRAVYRLHGSRLLFKHESATFLAVVVALAQAEPVG